MFDAAIIGAGISGLATAHALRQKGLKVVVLERQHRAGGNAVSERFGGFLMEHGPSTVSAISEDANRFSRQLDLDATRHPLGEKVRRRYLVGGGRLRGMSVHPLGFLMSGYLSPLARVVSSLNSSVAFMTLKSQTKCTTDLKEESLGWCFETEAFSRC